jgi:hypothetical protein
MPTLDDVYRKFGEVSEAAQLIETELGTSLLFFDIIEAGLISPDTLTVEDKVAARDILTRIERQTLATLLRNNKEHTGDLEKLEPLLPDALKVCNRLSHHFYREHSFRKFTEAGREVMMADLEAIHATLIDAYKALLLLPGTDIDKVMTDAYAKRASGNCVPEIDQTSVIHLPI